MLWLTDGEFERWLTESDINCNLLGLLDRFGRQNAPAQLIMAGETNCNMLGDAEGNGDEDLLGLAHGDFKGGTLWLIDGDMLGEF